MNFAACKRPAAVLVTGFALDLGCMLFLVLGSGVLPAGVRALSIIALVISSAVAAMSALIKRRKSLLTANLLLLGVFVSGWSFMRLFASGLEEAKAYGEALAREVAAIHRDRGEWPAVLDDIPAGKQPRVRASRLWVACPVTLDAEYRVVCGFFGEYRRDIEQPRLTAGRRDVFFTWDWRASRWQDGLSPWQEA